ncbi:hypothetical protein ACI78R_01370 [Geodermatophilus sp. SYSU D01106]
MSAWDCLVAANEVTRDAMVSKEVSPWVGSPFEWLMILPSRSKGAAAEKLTEQFLVTSGLAVGRPVNSGHDRLVNGHKVEIKMSTLWKGGTYTWQQIRDQDYEFCLLLGLSPQTASAWLVPKAVAQEKSVPQHGGQAGMDTRWLTVDAANPPDWMKEWGGTPDDFLVVAAHYLA